MKNGCIQMDEFICTLDTLAKQQECRYYEPSRDGEEYCRHNRTLDGDITDRCQCIDAQREVMDG